MRGWIWIFFVIVHSGVARAGDAPIIVRPGDGIIAASRLKLYDNAFVSTQIYADGRMDTPGIWTDQLRLRTVNGQKVFVRTQGLSYYDGRSLVSSNVFDAKTFAPIRDVQRNPDGSVEHWVFSGTHVDGHVVSVDGRDESRAFDFPAAFYDFDCCMRSIVMSMVQKKPALVVTIPAFEGDPTLSQVTLTVLRREKVRAGALGIVDAWLVETPLLGGYIHFWLTDRPPYMVRMVLSANTVNAYAQSFDMIGSTGSVLTPPPIPDAFGHGEPPPPK